MSAKLLNIMTCVENRQEVEVPKALFESSDGHLDLFSIGLDNVSSNKDWIDLLAVDGEVGIKSIYEDFDGGFWFLDAEQGEDGEIELMLCPIEGGAADVLDAIGSFSAEYHRITDTQQLNSPEDIPCQEIQSDIAKSLNAGFSWNAIKAKFEDTSGALYAVFLEEFGRAAIIWQGSTSWIEASSANDAIRTFFCDR